MTDRIKTAAEINAECNADIAKINAAHRRKEMMVIAIFFPVIGLLITATCVLLAMAAGS